MVDWMRIYESGCGKVENVGDPEIGNVYVACGAPDDKGRTYRCPTCFKAQASAEASPPETDAKAFQLEDGAAELLSIAHEVRTGGYTNRTLLAERLEAIAGRNRAALSTRQEASA